MKKVVLFRPKSSPSYEYIGAPLGLLSIATLIEKDHDIDIVDAVIDHDYLEKVLDCVEGAVCLGITSMTGYQIHEGLEVAKAVKETYPDIPIVWGGFHPSILPEQTIQSDCVDIVVRGWGIKTFSEIVYNLENNLPLSDILGITYKKNNEVFSTPDRPFEDTNNFPPVPYHLVDVERYVAPGKFASRNINYTSSYGCPFRCGFCAENKVNKRRWSGLTPERVLNDLEMLVEKYRINGIIFSDNNFFVNENRVKEICKGIIDRKLNIKWGHAEGRTGQLARYDESTWELIEKSGCHSILIGAESGSQEALNHIKKDIKVEDVIKLIEICKKHNIKVFFSFMFGFPRDEKFKLGLKEEFKQTLGLINKVRPTYDGAYFMWFMYMPYPGTPLYELSKKHGFEEPKSLEEWSRFNLLEETMPWVGKKHLETLKQLNTFIFPCVSMDSSTLYSMLDKRLKILAPLFIPMIKLLCHMADFRLRHNFFMFPVEYKLVKFAKNFRIYKKAPEISA